MRTLVIVAVIGLISFTAVFCGGSKAVAESSCQKTIKTSCTRCHSTDRICRKLSKTDADWPAIVKNMGRRANLNEDQQNTVLACLAHPAEQGGFECPK